MTDDSEDKICPFCKEAEFDLIGLKNHLMMGDCDLFNEVPSINAEMHRLRALLERKS